jgi:hypothetical protein
VDRCSTLSGRTMVFSGLSAPLEGLPSLRISSGWPRSGSSWAAGTRLCRGTLIEHEQCVVARLRRPPGPARTQVDDVSRVSSNTGRHRSTASRGPLTMVVVRGFFLRGGASTTDRSTEDRDVLGCTPFGPPGRRGRSAGAVVDDDGVLTQVGQHPLDQACDVLVRAHAQHDDVGRGRRLLGRGRCPAHRPGTPAMRNGGPAREGKSRRRRSPRPSAGPDRPAR